MGSSTATTSDAAMRRGSAQPRGGDHGLRRHAAIFSVSPPRRSAATTPSSSFLEAGGMARATRPCAHDVRHSKTRGRRVAIVDYGMGNLFSVKHACEQVGLAAVITSEREECFAADAVMLPGVGAFGDAMETLRRCDLVSVLRDVVAAGKPLLGICLGMQLLMSESEEFGCHDGLDIIQGDVVRLQPSVAVGRACKVPQVGWNRIVPPAGGRWNDSLLDGVRTGEFMYFVHSLYPRPVDPTTVVSVTRYGPIEFCSSVRFRNVFACQFHPERSGPQGLQLYRNFAAWLANRTGPEETHA